MERCVRCDGKELDERKEEDHLEVDGHTFSMLIPATKCRSCGESYLNGEALAHFELRVAAILARAGACSGAAFRFMRKTIGMRAADLAQLLDVTHETISRWETGKRAVDRGALATLGALVLDRLNGRQETLERLQALCEPKKLEKRILLKDDEAA